jgi:hypothetical protein
VSFREKYERKSKNCSKERKRIVLRDKEKPKESEEISIHQFHKDEFFIEPIGQDMKQSRKKEE